MPYEIKVVNTLTGGGIWSKAAPKNTLVQLANGSQKLVKTSEVEAFIAAEKKKLAEKRSSSVKRPAGEAFGSDEKDKKSSAQAEDNTASEDKKEQAKPAVLERRKMSVPRKPKATSAATGTSVGNANAARSVSTSRASSVTAHAASSTTAGRSASRASSISSRRGGGVSSQVGPRKTFESETLKTMKKVRKEFNYLSTDEDELESLDSETGMAPVTKKAKKMSILDDEDKTKYTTRTPHVTETYTEIQKKRKEEVTNVRQNRLALARAAAERREADREK